MISSLNNQAGRRYPQLRNLPAIPIGPMALAGDAPEPQLVNSLRGIVGLRPLFSGIVGLRSLFTGNAGVR